MSKSVPFIIGAQSVTLIVGGVPHMVANDNPRYEHLIQAIKDQDWDTVKAAATASKEFKNILGRYGDITVYGGHVTWRGAEIHGYLVNKMLEALSIGLPMEPLALFANNVQQNPDPRAAKDLYEWCEKNQHPLTEDGCFLAYKGVGADFTDHHTGTMDNSPGRVVELPREDCDGDPSRTCSSGLHFANVAYIRNGWDHGRIILLKINPRDVVAFPRDYGLSKGRACRYEVLQEIDPAELKDFIGYWPAPPPPKGPLDDYDDDQLFHLKTTSDQWYAERNCGLVRDRSAAHAYTKAEALTVLAEDEHEGLVAVPVDDEDEAADLSDLDLQPGDVDQGGYVTTIDDRLDELETWLGIDAPSDVVTERLDAIEHELGLTDDGDSIADRIERAERLRS